MRRTRTLRRREQVLAAANARRPPQCVRLGPPVIEGRPARVAADRPVWPVVLLGLAIVVVMTTLAALTGL